jgi:hypothetical protein
MMAAAGSVATRAVIARAPIGLTAGDDSRLEHCIGLACEAVEHHFRACQRCPPPTA